MGRLRFELRTNRLKAECSTAELATRARCQAPADGITSDLHLASSPLRRGITRQALTDRLARDSERPAMGKVAEVLPGVGQQLCLAQGGIVEGLRGTDPLQQLGTVMGDVVQEGVDQARLTVAVAHHQHPISRLQHTGEPAQVVMVERSALAGQVAIMAVGEVLIGGPEPMGLQGGLLHAITHEAVNIGATMVEADHQAAGLIAPLAGRLRSGRTEVGMDTGSLQQTPHPQHIVGRKHSVVPSRGMVQPGFTPIRQPQPQPLLIEPLDLTPQKLPESPQMVPADVVAQRMGEKGLERGLRGRSHGIR